MSADIELTNESVASHGPVGLVALLRCPATGAALRLSDGQLEAQSGTCVYPIVDGIPILIADDRSVFKAGEYVRSARTEVRREGRNRVRDLLLSTPPLSRNVMADENIRLLVELVGAAPFDDGKPRLLVVGGATRGEGMEYVLDSDRFDVVSTDITIGPETDVVCDAHDLPFGDESFDAVVCQAVLEHVLDPRRVVAEIHRVLRRGGVVYSEIPFMQQVHAGAYDFTRFTLTGHRLLFAYFAEISAGAQGGPGMALAWSLRSFLITLAGGSRVARAALARAAAFGAFWLPYLDGVLARRPAGVDAASGTFFLGRKAASQRPVDEILDAYDGAQRGIAYGRRAARAGEEARCAG